MDYDRLESLATLCSQHSRKLGAMASTIDERELKVTMNRIDLTSGKPVWTQPDFVKITLPAAAAR